MTTKKHSSSSSHSHIALATTLRDTEQRPLRTYLVTLTCTVILLALLSMHAQAGYVMALKHPARTALWLIGFIVSLIYAKKRSSVELASQHTNVALLAVTMMVTGYYNELIFWLILALLLVCVVSARSISLGLLHTCTSLAPVLCVLLLFHNDSQWLMGTIHAPNDSVLSTASSIEQWFLPLLALTIAVPLMRLLIDLLVFTIAGMSIAQAFTEYSWTRIALTTLTDLIAVVWVPIVLHFAAFAPNSSTAFSIFLITICTYSLLLMTVNTIQRNHRSRTVLDCLSLISSALPFPENDPAQTVVDQINKAIAHMNCFVSPSNNLAEPAHSYRYSHRIDEGSEHYYLVLERSVANRPFLPIDETLLQSAGDILAEVLRVNLAVTTLRTGAETDALTGTLNYHSFIAHLRSLRTENVHNRVAIAYFELSHLREINEQYSRLIGNSVLSTVAQRISEHMPAGATLSRVNGNEFAMIISNFDSWEEIEKLVSFLAQSACVPLVTEAGEVSVDVSTSLTFSNEAESFDSLLETANAHIYDSASMSQATSTYASVQQDGLHASELLQEAITQGKLTILYQPIFDLTSQEIASLDTTVRVHDKQGHLLSSHFVFSEARRLGLAAQLSSDVVQQCVTDIVQLRHYAPGLSNLGICINGSELDSPQFVDRLEQCGRAVPDVSINLQLGAHAIHALRDDYEKELEAIAHMPHVRVGLTHVGTSYSETYAFAHLPLSFARFDPSLIERYSDERTQQIVKRSVEIMRKDGFDIVFTGVSTMQQLEFIRSVGGRLVEGSLLSSPLSVSEMAVRLQTQGTRLSW